MKLFCIINSMANGSSLCGRQSAPGELSRSATCGVNRRATCLPNTAQIAFNLLWRSPDRRRRGMRIDVVDRQLHVLTALSFMQRTAPSPDGATMSTLPSEVARHTRRFRHRFPARVFGMSSSSNTRTPAPPATKPSDRRRVARSAAGSSLYFRRHGPHRVEQV